MASYDRETEIKAFDDTKAGVKGLVDAGVTQIPPFFRLPPGALKSPEPTSTARAEIPVIDLGIINGDPEERENVVELVRGAAERFGFFQVLNHGIPQSVLDEMLEGVRRFNEQELEVKKRYYTRDSSKIVRFNSNFDLYQSPMANWRDSLACTLAPEPAAKPEELPEVCRDIIMEYTSHIQRLGHLLFELLSEGLGLDTQYLNDLECGKGLSLLSHYYPPCPQPELTLGTSKHTDPDFLTVLLQDNIGGLQVLHEDQWFDVPPIPGALVINIGDLLQLITNDKFKSVEHRVLARKIGPRLSVACFFPANFYLSERRYGPIKKLLSEKNLPKYKDVTVMEYHIIFYSKGLDADH
ncbi:1-aminocyclopropane-1-carboxylate oxidase homolog 1-like isoform X2 [Phalaenopsis equestris]|uniref:1-aminocyclopropane-1-carboxylate oxidase homolog 1-like isoform X2 n=1 Tax=Phalaenopsis equestris TaxID=78828 RepID=UPI0009E1C0EB|nr:1-aminocyclopropane-1-carboxylate oxidase homolog 1-like isoform X2 [Phalaenopsis equestris]